MTAQDRTRPSKADTSKLDGGASPRLRWIEFGSPAAIAIHVPLGVGLLGIYVLVANASRNQASVQGR